MGRFFFLVMRLMAHVSSSEISIGKVFKGTVWASRVQNREIEDRDI